MRCNWCGRFVIVIGQQLAQYHVMCSKCGLEITERPIIETVEQANQICLDLWNKIIQDIESKKYSKLYLDKYKFNIFDIKIKLVGEYNWQDNCPLCEYHTCNTCPIQYCYEFGFGHYMTFKQIKKFYKNIQLKIGDK